jgi:hypothetical protein
LFLVYINKKQVPNSRCPDISHELFQRGKDVSVVAATAKLRRSPLPPARQTEPGNTLPRASHCHAPEPMPIAAVGPSTRGQRSQLPLGTLLPPPPYATGASADGQAATPSPPSARATPRRQASKTRGVVAAATVVRGEDSAARVVAHVQRRIQRGGCRGCRPT